MIEGPALQNLTASIAELCRSGSDAEELRARVLPRLRQAVPIDALWWATVDPATLLFTSAYREEIPEETGPFFVENEFLDDDQNKWTDLARDPRGVRTLLEATDGDLHRSPRHNDIFEPLGLQDELRAVLRTQGTPWGYLCLHRDGQSGFSRDEVEFVKQIAPHLAEGIRLGLLMNGAEQETAPDAPGLVVLALDGSVVSANAASEQWVAELSEPSPGALLPIEVYAIAAQLRRLDSTDRPSPRLRVRTRAGRWAILHGSWLSAEDHATVAVIIERATPIEVAPLLMAACGLTKQQRAVTGLVCQGLSTKEIATHLYVVEATVQDHLKAVFEKTGARSRRELVATILKQDYLPRARAKQPLASSGFFAA